MIKLAPLSVGISSVKATNTFWVLSLTPVVDFSTVLLGAGSVKATSVIWQAWFVVWYYVLLGCWQ